MAMPEIPINEDGDPVLWEDKIWLAEKRISATPSLDVVFTK
jgi:hypothetical protein